MSRHHPHHAPDRYSGAFAIGVALNVLFVVIEAGYGFVAGSLALLADAGHNLSDVLGLLLAWGAGSLATRRATDRRTYGFRKVTVMAALASATLLLVALGGIAWEAVQRFLEPRPVTGLTIIAVAAIGVVINTVTALLFIRGQRHDLNVRGAFLHMAADAAVSLGVVLAGAVILIGGWLWVDPVTSLMIVAVVFASTWGLLRDSLNYATDAVPENIDMDSIRQYLLGLDSVADLHDLHVWPLSTTETALTVHLVVTVDCLDNEFLQRVQQDLHDRFGIEHATIQVETMQSGSYCLLHRDNCIQQG